MTEYGGKYNRGTLFNYNISSDTETKAHDFGRVTIYPQSPHGSLIEANNGLLYGLTYQGGAHGNGTIFNYNTSTGSETDLHDFGSGTDGTFPNGSLIQARNGLLYGLTYEGGVHGRGIIFSFDISTGTEMDVYDFGSDTDGVYPEGSLMRARNGMLYGMTIDGGVYGYGTIFSYNTSTRVETVVHNFGHGTGRYPIGSLMQAGNGLLYGMTTLGGINNGGVIFNFNMTDGKETVLHAFGRNLGDGLYPHGSLIQAGNGLLYGLTSQGGLYNRGIIFSYDISKWTETDLHNFDSSKTDGQNPLGSLIQAGDSLLYGMTSRGGVNDSGVIFNFDISNNTETRLHDFGNGSDGQFPYGSFIQASNGVLYGVTSEGGTHKLGGVILSYDIVNEFESDVHDFGDVIYSKEPTSTLIQASNGLLYGMTPGGGANQSGTIFSYDIANDTETDLHDFGGGTDGTFPTGSLMQASNGLLYGITEEGGTNHDGTIFSYEIHSGKEIDLYDFPDVINADLNNSSLVQASNGLLYGITSLGGNGDGTIFSYDISTGKETDLYSFGRSFTDGELPTGSLIQATNGKLYGMTYGGGANANFNGGTIFSYDISSGTETDLYDFSGIDGLNPRGSLIQASDGLLYGMTTLGGTTYNHGTIFSYDISSGKETVVHDFSCCSDGQEPLGSLIQSTNSLLYGMTAYGGTIDEGTLFSYDISSGKETVIHDFGINPQDGLEPSGNLIEINITINKNRHANSIKNIQLYPNPSSTNTYLSFQLQNKQRVNISLYNTMGQEVWTESLEHFKDVSTTIPLTGLANGVYILKVNCNGILQQEEIIVAK